MEEKRKKLVPFVSSLSIFSPLNPDVCNGGLSSTFFVSFDSCLETYTVFFLDTIDSLVIKSI